MTANDPYPIGTPGTPWGQAEKDAWFAAQSIKRSYAEQVLARLEALIKVKEYSAEPVVP